MQSLPPSPWCFCGKVLITKRQRESSILKPCATKQFKSPCDNDDHHTTNIVARLVVFDLCLFGYASMSRQPSHTSHPHRHLVAHIPPRKILKTLPFLSPSCSSYVLNYWKFALISSMCVCIGKLEPQLCCLGFVVIEFVLLFLLGSWGMLSQQRKYNFVVVHNRISITHEGEKK